MKPQGSGWEFLKICETTILLKVQIQPLRSATTRTDRFFSILPSLLSAFLGFLSSHQGNETPKTRKKSTVTFFPASCALVGTFRKSRISWTNKDGRTAMLHQTAKKSMSFANFCVSSSYYFWSSFKIHLWIFEVLESIQENANYHKCMFVPFREFFIFILDPQPISYSSLLIDLVIYAFPASSSNTVVIHPFFSSIKPDFPVSLNLWGSRIGGAQWHLPTKIHPKFLASRMNPKFWGFFSNRKTANVTNVTPTLRHCAKT